MFFDNQNLAYQQYEYIKNNINQNIISNEIYEDPINNLSGNQSNYSQYTFEDLPEKEDYINFDYQEDGQDENDENQIYDDQHQYSPYLKQQSILNFKNLNKKNNMYNNYSLTGNEENSLMCSFQNGLNSLICQQTINNQNNFSKEFRNNQSFSHQYNKSNIFDTLQSSKVLNPQQNYQQPLNHENYHYINQSDYQKNHQNQQQLYEQPQIKHHVNINYQQNQHQSQYNNQNLPNNQLSCTNYQNLQNINNNHNHAVNSQRQSKRKANKKMEQDEDIFNSSFLKFNKTSSFQFDRIESVDPEIQKNLQQKQVQQDQMIKQQNQQTQQVKQENAPEQQKQYQQQEKKKNQCGLQLKGYSIGEEEDEELEMFKTNYEKELYIKIKKNMFKNITHQIMTYIETNKKELSEFLVKSGINPKRFFKRYKARNYRVTNQEQFVALFSHKNYKVNVERAESEKKALRIIAFKFLRTELLQYCLHMSRIVHFGIFIRVRHRILKLLQIMDSQ
ncbi:hypothetical protein PPERSA_12806 [Pseudocohnilembus persalinus]|uniref:Uncharacterized protein n=1 Tax=Pseudocohnilembus persalinus TaxID=266149 RepID=A0A0V0QEM5_PSEPJ|nr:hypothetical protein PPERSA_12806 [Pseudocohnilembus persalinus]|eukprot:KRX00587.1 hypothetical protein PPERSA_12806 [Pseudocohnilembus persalinus]